MTNIFNQQVKIVQRNRAAHNIKESDFLIRESARNIADIIEHEISLTLPEVLDIGCRNGDYIYPLLSKIDTINDIIQCDISSSMIENLEGAILLENNQLPFDDNQFNLVTDILNIHWLNNVQLHLRNIYNILRDKGLFIGSIFGGDTLKELREVVYDVEMHKYGGVSARMAPAIHLKDAGRLLHNAGFKLPVANNEIYTAKYCDIYSLIKDLRYMGETNAMNSSAKTFMSRSTMKEINDLYVEKFADADGNIIVTFEIITISGWKN